MLLLVENSILLYVVRLPGFLDRITHPAVILINKNTPVSLYRMLLPKLSTCYLARRAVVGFIIECAIFFRTKVLLFKAIQPPAMQFFFFFVITSQPSSLKQLSRVSSEVASFLFIFFLYDMSEFSFYKIALHADDKLLCCFLYIYIYSPIINSIALLNLIDS